MKLRRKVRHGRRFRPTSSAGAGSRGEVYVGSGRNLSKPAKKPRLSWLLRSIPIVIIAGALAYLLLFSGFFEIRSVEVSGPSSGLSAELQTATQSYLKTSWLSQNWLFLDTHWLESQLKKQFSQAEKIVVSKQFPNKLILQTDEQSPAMVWQSGSTYYLISRSGRVIADQTATENPDLPRVVDTNNVPAKPGDYVVSKNFVDFVGSVKKFFAARNLGPNELSVAETTSQLVVKTKAGYVVKFDTTEDVNTQLRALGALLDLLASQKKKPAEYIDLRIPGKTFYK